MLATLKELLPISALSGREDALAEHLVKRLTPLCDSVQIDPMGNVLAHRRGTSGMGRILLTAHTDQSGMIVTHIGEKGYLSVAYLGAPVPAALVYSEVVFANGTRGVLVPASPSGEFAQDQVVIDLGVRSRRAAERKVKIGDCATLIPHLTHLGTTRYSGTPLDNRLGCAILLKTAETVQAPVSDVWYAFTAAQLLGNRGARTAAFAVKPDLAVSVDLISAGDAYGAKEQDGVLGGGAAIVRKSGDFISDQKLCARLHRLADTDRISVQDVIRTQGTTDAAAIQMSGAGAATALLAIPARNLHTGAEMIDLADAKAAYQLTCALAKEPI